SNSTPEYAVSNISCAGDGVDVLAGCMARTGFIGLKLKHFTETVHLVQMRFPERHLKNTIQIKVQFIEESHIL
ncbi:MAG: hypothetical protein ACYC4Q_05390, partial [Victivallaceae bacterium]